MIIFRNIIKNSSILSTIFILFSCNTVGPNSVNNDFQNKFGDQVQKIREYYQSQNIDQNPKVISDDDNKKIKEYSEFDNPVEIFNIAGPIQKQQANVETQKIIIKPKKFFGPTMNDYNRSLANSRNRVIPADIFEIKYNINQFPPFKTTGVEFDKIRIPSQDAYGINSDLNQKEYKIAQISYLQRSIDNYDKNRTNEDLEFSKILIKEQKNLIRQKKSMEIFGNNSEEESQSREKQEDWAKKLKEQRNDPVNKIISAQIAAYNIYKNSSVNSVSQQNGQNPQNQQNQGQQSVQNQKLNNQYNQNNRY